MRKQKMLNLNFSLFLLLIVIGLNTCFAQQDGDEISLGKYKVLYSEILGEDRTLLIHLPEGYDRSEHDYPVFYMLYGDHTTTYFAETVAVLSKYGSSARIPRMILVAVTNTDRYRDLIPFDRNGNKTGIDNFIDFFSRELIPYVENNYRVNSYKILMGPQAGANFALYTLFMKPDLFDAFIISNPFRWQSGRDLFLENAEDYFSKHEEFKKFVFITHDNSDELERQGNLYIQKLEEIVDKYNPEGFKLILNYIPESDDFFSPLGVKEGVKTLFKDYRLPDEYTVENLRDIIEYYKDLSVKLDFNIHIPGHILSRQSDKLMSNRKEQEAVEIYHYMLKTGAYPADAYWRLTNISIRDEDYKSAKLYLEKMLEILDGDVGMIKKRYDWVVQKLEQSEQK